MATQSDPAARARRAAVGAPPKGETADQWWERVRAEHGPPPQKLRDLYNGIRTRHVARQEQAAKSTQGGGVS
jgi:hypothetical protein